MKDNGETLNFYFWTNSYFNTFKKIGYMKTGPIILIEDDADDKEVFQDILTAHLQLIMSSVSQDPYLFIKMMWKPIATFTGFLPK